MSPVRNLFDQPTGLGACPMCKTWPCRDSPGLGRLVPRNPEKEAAAMQKPVENKAVGLTPRSEVEDKQAEVLVDPPAGDAVEDE